MTTSVDIRNWIKNNFFDVAPMAISVIDTDFNIVYANNNFERIFGEWENRKCHLAYKNRDSLCINCKGREAFADGMSKVSEEAGHDKNGRFTRYLQHTIPVKNDKGKFAFLIEISIDITESDRIRKEHQLLFDQVPCNIMLINKDFRITKTNKKIREMFGNIEGQYCFESLKGLDKKCKDCPAHQTFLDGQAHTGHSVVQDLEGQQIDLHVTTIPMDIENGKIDLVMEMGVDITQTLKLEDELKIAYSFMESMIAASLDAIIAIDEKANVTIFNQAARNIFNVSKHKQITMDELRTMLPEGFIEQISSGLGHVYFPEIEVETLKGDLVPVRLTGIQVIIGDTRRGMAISIQDLREIKQLEKDNLEAERLAAVGQTVAGLAHGVKNLITGLDGGMYMLNSGLRKSEAERIGQGLEMLTRNIKRISIFVKEFLSFSKGREIRVELSDPLAIAKEVVDMYAPETDKLGIHLIFEKKGEIKPAPIDYEGLHECLTNLVGNAIDACKMSDNDERHVIVKAFESKDIIIYEVVDDGCGMDYEVKQKVFTTFFTTKGLGGTGLGLLTTKKIVQEHGGVIEVDSTLDKGTTFRIKLPRKRLPKPAGDD